MSKALEQRKKRNEAVQEKLKDYINFREDMYKLIGKSSYYLLINGKSISNRKLSLIEEKFK